MEKAGKEGSFRQEENEQFIRAAHSQVMSQRAFYEALRAQFITDMLRREGHGGRECEQLAE